MEQQTSFVKDFCIQEAHYQQWERRLLDLTLRNNLLNLQSTKNVLPLAAPNLVALEDSFINGLEYTLLQQPSEWGELPKKSDLFELECDLEMRFERAQWIQAEFSSQRLRVLLPQAQVEATMRELFYQAKLSFEETGTNALYLTLGLLRWNQENTGIHYAPVILLPVNILRKPAGRGYTLRLRDEEPQVNLVLLELLRQKFDIDIRELDPLPMYGRNIDLHKVFDVLEQAIKTQRGWKILNSVYLSIFNFSAFLLWNDIQDRLSDLMQNKLVNSLLSDRLCFVPREFPIVLDGVLEQETLLPLPADAWQLSAIQAASMGQSFVLHGPPGTGKSQTIAGIIANTLAQGKTVLFVAEKMAALSVVERRLDAIGIGPFCLKLYSDRSQKRDVLDQFRAASAVIRQTSPEEYARRYQQLTQIRNELDEYCVILHTVQPCGMSLYQLIEGYEANRSLPDIVQLPFDLAHDFTSDTLHTWEGIVGQLIAAGQAVGHPLEHPLCAIQSSKYTQTLRASLPPLLVRYADALTEVEERAKALCVPLKLPLPGQQKEWMALYEIAGQSQELQDVPKAWMKHPDLSNLIGDVRKLEICCTRARQQREALAYRWLPGFFEQDGEALALAWRATENKNFLVKSATQGKILRKLLEYCDSKLDKADLGRQLAQLCAYQQDRNTIYKILKKWNPQLVGLYAGKNTDWKHIESICMLAQHGSDRLAALTGSETVRMQLGKIQQPEDVTTAYQNAWKALQVVQEEAQEALQLDENLNASPDWLQTLRQTVEDCKENLDALRDWMTWRGVRERARQAGMDGVVKAYESGCEEKEIFSATCKAIYRVLILDVFKRYPQLNRFSGTVFDQQIQWYKQLDDELKQLEKQEIYCRLAAKIPKFSQEAAQNSEVGILQRAIRNGGRDTSVRRLFEKIPGLLPRICPCMLMSTSAVAAYLQPSEMLFDVVIFDEASQIPTCKAVSALARSKAMVVVGDSKQLSPSRLFQSVVLDEGRLEAEEPESLLEDCLALALPQMHLSWHYRSRHESLIAFSNAQFYDRRLCTFPSPDKHEQKVRLIQIEKESGGENAAYDLAEAKAVVAELQCRFADAQLKKYSVGVVTFRLKQQIQIENLFLAACQKDPALEVWANRGEEPLFIKKAENVQGDERDVILLSVGYGLNAQGEMPINFGSLEKEDGWRQLNVAISRARQEMLVFTSLRLQQLDIQYAKAKGVEALKGFLQYVAGDNVQLVIAKVPERTPGVAAGLCARLEAEGYTTCSEVGHSTFRVDVGVYDPKHPDKYILGILLDGDPYRKARTTRDRELSLPAMLHSLGWNLYRMWSVDWWENSDREIDKILDFLKQLETEDAAPTLPEDMDATSFVPVMARNAPEAKMDAEVEALELPYRVTALSPLTLTVEEFLSPHRRDALMARLQTVVNVEAPIVDVLLCDRVLQSCGILRSSARINHYLQTLLPQLKANVTQQGRQWVYWREGQRADEYMEYRYPVSEGQRRNAQVLPMQEVANAVCAVLAQQRSLSKENLIGEVAKLLGYTRLGSALTAAVVQGREYALQQGWISLEDNGDYTL